MSVIAIKINYCQLFDAQAFIRASTNTHVYRYRLWQVNFINPNDTHTHTHTSTIIYINMINIYTSQVFLL